MGLTEIVTPDRVSVAGEAEGVVRTHTDAIRRLAVLLAQRQSVVSADEIEAVLTERERLQSTGVGGGVAIPHGAIDRLDRTIGAVLVCADPIAFSAIDGAPVSIFFAVIGPKRAAGEHLKALARVSRILRPDSFRERLIAARNGREAYELIAAEERGEVSLAVTTLGAGSTPRPAPPPVLTVRALMTDPALGIELVLLAGEAGLDRIVKHARIQKSGLALVGHFHGIVPTRIQILGQTELSFLHRLGLQDRSHYLRGFFKLGLCCVIVTQAQQLDGEGSGVGVMPVPELAQCAEEAETPLLLSNDRSSMTINSLHALLDDRLAPRVRLHGVLVDVFGVGLLLVGPSAIGKSETALDLVMRGHRLVADDAVECDFRPPGMVFGAAAELLRHHLEVRGLGILNIKDLFGVTAIRERKRIDVVVRLVEWSKDTEYDRLGLDDHHHTILGVNIRELVIPVRPGRDMASILEVAARNELLKNAGHHAAREFFSNLEGALITGEHPQDESAVLPPVRVPQVPSSGVPNAHAPRVTHRPPESSAGMPAVTLPSTKPRGQG